MLFNGRGVYSGATSRFWKFECSWSKFIRPSEHPTRQRWFTKFEQPCTCSSESNSDLSIRALLNHETAKHRNTETAKQRNSYFFPTFFLEHRNSQRNKLRWYWFCWEIYGICKEGLQTWMSRCAIDSLDKQSGWKLSLSLVEKYMRRR